MNDTEEPLHTSKKVALVTGATSGIGKAVATALLSDNWIVYGIGRRPAPEAVPAELRYFSADVSSPESMEECRHRIVSEVGCIDLIVCCAGSGISGPVEETPLESVQAQFGVNFYGVLHTVQAFLPCMRARGEGKIIIIGSIAGRIGLPFQAFYSASKFALEGLTEALRHEVRPFGIEITIVEPGDFRTEFTGARKKHIAPDSPYRKSFERAMSVQEHDEQHGWSAEAAGRKIAKLARMRHLPVRCTVGPFFERLAVWLRRLLPDRWMEALYKMYYRQ
ncbi:MAG: SDR family oxidoreductase [Rectinema sp.]|nr:SDR family oxidoreductase [Rectinema sp.]